MTPEVGPHPSGFVKLQILPDLDARYGYAAKTTLEDASASIEPHHPNHDDIEFLLTFFRPLFTSHGPVFDDSGGQKSAIGPVLKPERCRSLLDYWQLIDAVATKMALDQLPLFFDLAERPHKKFRNAEELMIYLSCYADFMDQASSKDMFYFSFDGNSLVE